MTVWPEINKEDEQRMSVDPKSSHYDVGGVVTLDVIKAKLTPEQYEGFLLGCALKYLCRLNFKDNKNRDLEKALVYLKELQKETSQDTLFQAKEYKVGFTVDKKQ